MGGVGDMSEVAKIVHAQGVRHERNHIRKQVTELRDEAKANRSKTFTTTRGDVFKEEAYNEVLTLLDGETNED